MIAENEAKTTHRETMKNPRLSGNTKVIKCAFCDTLESLKPFGGSYVCESCVSYIKQTTNNS